MDKVKQILEVLRKHHFWILCCLAALVGLLVWYSASGKLETEFQRDSNKINGVFADLGKIQNPHPNNNWTEGATKATGTAHTAVYGVWKKFHEQQKEKAFIWPEQLGKPFLDAVPGLEREKPELTKELCELYQNRIKQVASQLANIVDAPVIEEPVAGGAQSAPPDANSDLDHKVVWPQLGDIQASFDFPDQPPSPLLVKQMQEEYWVYKAICNVIKEVNQAAAGPRDAPISAIDEMAVAYAAVEDGSSSGGQRGILHKANSNTNAPAAPQADASRTAKPDIKTRGKPDALRTTGAEGAPANPDDYWKSWRYVKPTGEPLMAAELDSASAEYNLMPFRLKLDMNPDFLDRFLLNCRNSDLPIEVKSVRINPGIAQGMAGGTGGARPEPVREGAGGAVRGIHSQKIEITGVVYLVKPPDPQKLGITPQGEPATTETAAATPPGGAAVPAPTEASK